MLTSWTLVLCCSVCIPYCWLSRPTGDMEPIHVFVDITPSLQFWLEAELEVGSRPSIQSYCWTAGALFWRKTYHMATQGADWLFLYSGYHSRSMCVTSTGYETHGSILMVNFWFQYFYSSAIVLRYYHRRHISLYPSLRAYYYSATFYELHDFFIDVILHSILMYRIYKATPRK